MFEKLFIRYDKHESLFEYFFVSSVVSILVIRFSLKLANYPQLGGKTLHIAHMLWGGLLLLIAFLAVSLMISNSTKFLAAIFGGIGFGMFIDEVGKFVTRDNDYFYQPTFAIVYVVFVLIYLVYRLLDRMKPFSKIEYLANSIELLKDMILNDLDTEEHRRALHYLKKSDKDNLLTPILLRVFEEVKNLQKPRQHILSKLKNSLRSWYFGFAHHRLFRISVAIFFIVKAIISLLLVTNLHRIDFFNLPISERIELASSILSGFFIIIGVFLLYRSRVKAYHFFRYATLTSLLLGRVFDFYRNPIQALVSVTFDLLVLLTLHNLTLIEERESYSQVQSA